MSNYVTTNVRLPETDYLRLKTEAVKKRVSLSAVIREKVSEEKETPSKIEVERFMSGVKKLAAKNAKKLKGMTSVEVIRQIREEN